MTIIHNLLHLLLLLATVSPRMFSGRVLANSSAPNKAPWTKATLLSTNARAKSGYPWRRVPLAAFPGVGVPQCDQRPSGLLTSKEINFLAQRYSIVSLGGSTTDPKNKTCGELRVADAARRLKHASNTVRPHFYLNNVIDYRMYCASEIFDAKPSWRLKLANGSDYQIRGLYAHDISQASVREWWASAVTNSSFVSEIDGVFADKAVTDMITFHGVSPEKNQAMFEGELKQLALAKQKLGNTKNLVFNGIRAEQLQISSGGTLAALEQADGGEFEHFAILENRYPNGSLVAEHMVIAMDFLINVSEMTPPKTIIVRSMPGPCVHGGTSTAPDSDRRDAIGCTWPNATTPASPAAKQAATGKYVTFPLAAFLIVAGPEYHFDYSWGYRSNSYVPHADSGTDQDSYMPDTWIPAFLKAPGTPQGPAIRHGSSYRYSREWSGVSVSVDVQSEEASIRWK
eukprot:m.185092 g.185092  ORF g.185092 m.185092 type:complete len:456 (-) comp18491_c1_seq14:386-1753(-)